MFSQRMKNILMLVLVVGLAFVCFKLYNEQERVDRKLAWLEEAQLNHMNLVGDMVYCVGEELMEQGDRLDGLVANITADLDLSVLASCGIITDGRGHGSCVAIGSNLILTAGHCLEIPDAWIEIGGVKYEIKSKWRDVEFDVGFVVIDANLPYLELGDDPKVLDEVYIIGSPHRPTFVNGVSRGIVCKTNLVYSDSVVDWNGDFFCDAMAWQGNSGGPVVKKCGKIVGIYVGLFTNVDNFSVCVPVSQIKDALERMYY